MPIAVELAYTAQPTKHISSVPPSDSFSTQSEESIRRRMYYQLASMGCSIMLNVVFALVNLAILLSLQHDCKEQVSVSTHYAVYAMVGTLFGVLTASTCIALVECYEYHKRFTHV